MPDTPIGIIGTDSHTPQYLAFPSWHMWSIHEIYMGQEGLNRFIPKVNDYVIEPETGRIYIVVSIDPVTWIPELAPKGFSEGDTTNIITNSINGDYRLYYDTSVSPWTLTVDGFMRVYSTEASFARIYRGLFIDPTKIISRRYNNSGVFIGHDIPLQNVVFNSHDNQVIKHVPTCNTEAVLPDGESCTVVFFTSSGKVLKSEPVLVENTSYVAQAYSEQKYITEIFLKSAFIANSQAVNISYPNNLPIASFNPIGVVQYNDGSQVEYPVDGTRFTLFGLDGFVSTVVGHAVPLVLKYRMDPSEAALADVTTNGHDVVRPYTLKVGSSNTSYNVKLFVYPVWVDDVSGYVYKVYLTNLDRNIVLDVTSHVGLASNSPAFQPMAYGVTQRLTFTVDLANVSGIFNHFQHVQVMDIILRAPASDTSQTNIWEVASQVPAPGSYYGTNLRATRDLPTQKKITISNNFQTKQEFLDKLYKPLHPVYNTENETGPLSPTHMEVMHQGEKIIVSVDDFQTAIQFTHAIPLLSNVVITFLRNSPSGYLKLAVAVLTVR